jgi:hypothetical protein
LTVRNFFHGVGFAFENQPDISEPATTLSNHANSIAQTWTILIFRIRYV